MVTIRVADSPRDFSYMYKAGQSCMAIDSRNCTAAGWELLEKYDLWLSSTYAYMPRIRGYWIEAADRPVARAICLDKALTTVYAENELFERQLKFALEDEGYIEKYQMGHAELEDFEVPGLELDKEFYCFVPKYDFRAQFMIRFNPKTHRFIWSQKWQEAPAYILTDGHLPNGTLSATQVQNAAKLWR